MKESSPLQWPEGWIRTRPQDQVRQGQWGHTYTKYRDLLETELNRMGIVGEPVLTTNRQGQLEPRDPGVAVYFSRKVAEDYKWQDILEIKAPYPSREQVESAYRQLAARYHSDNILTHDLQMFLAISEAKKKALDWIEKREGRNHEQVIACDQFKEVRLNLNAIRLTISYLRGLERCGTSALLERAFKGFAVLPENVIARSA